MGVSFWIRSRLTGVVQTWTQKCPIEEKEYAVMATRSVGTVFIHGAVGGDGGTVVERFLVQTHAGVPVGGEKPILGTVFPCGEVAADLVCEALQELQLPAPGGTGVVDLGEWEGGLLLSHALAGEIPVEVAREMPGAVVKVPYREGDVYGWAVWEQARFSRTYEAAVRCTRLQAVVYSEASYLADPQVTSAQKEGMTKFGATHVVVAMLGSQGGDSPRTPFRTVVNALQSPEDWMTKDIVKAIASRFAGVTLVEGAHPMGWWNDELVRLVHDNAGRWDVKCRAELIRRCSYWGKHYRLVHDYR
jgi:hypothetical protein